MTLKREDVIHVANLARLQLASDEIEPILRDLAQIIDYVAELSALDTSSVPPTSQLAVELAPFRADVPAPGLPADVALAEAPRRSESSFAVPAFVEEP
jgi:aspartyl-tRNA(Asn)/glutamyl-tRNA(Gln) amidotransferase subunit C